MRALLVEDNEGVAKWLRDKLQPFAEITRKANLMDGIEEAQSSNYDVALIDLNLPDSEGVDTVRSFVASCPDVAAVVMTGEDAGLAPECVEYGAHDFVQKGETLSGESLWRILRYAIERHHRQKLERMVESLPCVAQEVRRVRSIQSEGIDELRKINGMMERVLKNVDEGRVVAGPPPGHQGNRAGASPIR